jgi:hypothetical protein
MVRPSALASAASPPTWDQCQWQILSRKIGKNAPDAKKYCPKGEITLSSKKNIKTAIISPDLVKNVIPGIPTDT